MASDYVGYKVTNPSPGVWHYEYACHNQNLDRAIQSFSVPVGGSCSTNIGFHAPATATGLDLLMERLGTPASVTPRGRNRKLAEL